MKKIEAIIQPFKLDEIKNALSAIGVHGMTVTDAHGFGRQKGHVDLLRGAEVEVTFLSKIKVELAVSDAIADKVIAAIQEKAKTGKIGYGKIYISRIVDIVRIRTGENGEAAI